MHDIVLTWFRHLVDRSGRTAVDLAKALGYKKGGIGGILNGNTQLSPQALTGLIMELGIDRDKQLLKRLLLGFLCLKLGANGKWMMVKSGLVDEAWFDPMIIRLERGNKNVRTNLP